MVTIGGKQVIFSTSFMTMNDQDALVEFPFENEVIQLAFTFKPGEDGIRQPSIQWKTENKSVHFSFKGWDTFSLFALSPGGPAELGVVVDGKALYVQLAHHFNLGQNLVHLFILTDKNSG